MTAEAAPAQRAALLCFHPRKHVEATYWDSVEQARQAEAELTPGGCSARCVGVHSVVAVDLELAPPRPRPASRTDGTTSGHARRGDSFHSHLHRFAHSTL